MEKDNSRKYGRSGKSPRRAVFLALSSVVTVAKPKSAIFLTTTFEKSPSHQALVRQQDLVSKSEGSAERWLPHREGQEPWVRGLENTVIFKETSKFDKENLPALVPQKSCANKMTCAINNFSSFHYQQATKQDLVHYLLESRTTDISTPFSCPSY